MRVKFAYRRRAETLKRHFCALTLIPGARAHYVELSGRSSIDKMAHSALGGGNNSRDVTRPPAV